MIIRYTILGILLLLSACSAPIQQTVNQLNFAKTEALINKIEEAREMVEYSESKFERLLNSFLRKNMAKGEDTFSDDYELTKTTVNHLNTMFPSLKEDFTSLYNSQLENPDLSVKTKAELENTYVYFQTLQPLMETVLADTDILLTDYQQAVKNKRLLSINSTVKLSERTQQLQAKQTQLANEFAKLVVALQLTI